MSFIARTLNDDSAVILRGLSRDGHVIRQRVLHPAFVCAAILRKLR